MDKIRQAARGIRFSEIKLTDLDRKTVVRSDADQKAFDTRREALNYAIKKYEKWLFSADKITKGKD